MGYPRSQSAPPTSPLVEAQKAARDARYAARKARGKILRAVNVILAKKSQPAADMKALFEGTKARVGKKPEKADAKK